LAAFSASRPGHTITGLTAVFWHFVEVSRELTSAERVTLEGLLHYGPRDEVTGDSGHLLLVVPRPGTLSPWSSKATNIARNCGLAAVRRIERGTAYYLSSGLPALAAAL